MSHTSGPWTLETVPTSVGICHKIGPFPSTGFQKDNYACVYVDNRRIDEPASAISSELEANARLIAAAPDLMGVCLLADDMLGRYYSADDEDTRGGLALKAIRAAIAKAGGLAVPA